MTDRRSFLKKSAALAALSAAPGALALGNNTDHPPGKDPGAKAENERILPARLKAGDTVGLVTPGSSIEDDQLKGTIEKLERLGFKTYHTDAVTARYGYFAGPDQQRADDLMHMFTLAEVDAIWCVRGGYGSIRILDLLDFNSIAENPKVLIGYSDITALLTSIYQETGLVTFHGPVGITEMNRFNRKSIKKVLLEPADTYQYPYKRGADSRDNPEFDRYTITGGIAEGELIGGNISVLDSIIGTRYETDFKGKIVYLEEIEEKTYRVDKMLFHLLQGTNLDEAAGLVLGVFKDCSVEDEPSLSLKEAIEGLLKPLDIPVSYGLSFGHIDRMITLPNGIRARLNADKNSLGILERAVY